MHSMTPRRSSNLGCVVAINNTEYKPQVLQEPTDWLRLQPRIPEPTLLFRTLEGTKHIDRAACYSTMNNYRYLREPNRHSIPFEEPKYLQQSAQHSTPRILPEPTIFGESKCQQEPVLCPIPQANLKDLWMASGTETKSTGITWTSRLLELANKEFDSVPIYSSIPTNPHSSPMKQCQVILTVGEVSVTAEGPSHDTACEEAAKRAIHILTGTSFNSEKPADDASSIASRDEDTEPDIQLLAIIPPEVNKRASELKYSSSPILVLHKIATMLSKPVGFSRFGKRSGTASKDMRVTCSLGDWITCGQGSNEELAKLAAVQLMLTHLDRSNVYGINWSATIKMLDGNMQGTNVKKSSSKPLTNANKSPISRLFEFQQKKKESEPVFEVTSVKNTETGILEHVVQVTVGSLTASGCGTTYKTARRAAARKAVNTMISYGLKI